jgi:hypothetical protein
VTVRDASTARRWWAVVAASLMTGALLAPEPPAAAAADALPPIHHVWVIQLENESYASALTNNPNAYLGKTVPGLGQVLTQYYATGHESLDNYISEISGQAPNPVTQADCQIYTNVLPGTMVAGQSVGAGCVYPAAVPTVADELTAKGLSWKAYMGDMGNNPARDHTTAGTCGHPVLNSQDGTQSATASDQYATRHDPFVYFHSIIDNPAQCGRVVSLAPLAGDVARAATTPNFSWITPNLCDDGHDATCAGTNLAGARTGGLAATDLFLAHWVPLITSSPAFKADGVLVLVWDESDTGDGASCCGETPGPSSPLPGIVGPGGGHVAAIVMSRFTKPGTTNATPYNHYALLRTVEDIFGLGHLGEAAAPGLRSWGSDVFDAAATSASPLPAAAPTTVAGAAAAGAPSSGPALPVTGRWPATGAGVLVTMLAVAGLLIARRARAAAQHGAPSREGPTT